MCCGIYWSGKFLYKFNKISNIDQPQCLSISTLYAPSGQTFYKIIISIET